MDSKEGKTPGDLDRRASTRSSVRYSVSVSNNELDEDYDALAANGLVADGFHPPQTPSQHLQDSGDSTPSRPPSSPATTTSTSTTTGTLVGEDSLDRNRPSSVSKHRPRMSSLSTTHEQDEYQQRLSRHASVSTDSTSRMVLPIDSPYQGPVRPSHPYQMYPQTVRGPRSMSMTTTSSSIPPAVIETPYTGPRGPSHPYSLYPQGTGIDLMVAPNAAIPIGFHGLPDQYHRRIGPDGDDLGDIIGPDGHTEQLPPYTRYPEEVYLRKGPLPDEEPPGPEVVCGPPPLPPPPPLLSGATVLPTGAMNAPQVPRSGTPVIPGAGGIGLATRNPEFESTDDDLGSPRSRHSSRSFGSDESHGRFRANDESERLNEKTGETRPQRWLKRKMCGVIPYWAICLTVLILVVMAVVMSTVMGIFLTREKKRGLKNKQPQWDPNFDAIPIAPPPDLQPLPLGTYSMPLINTRSSNTCFQNTTLAQAWNCRLIMVGLQLTISKEGDDYKASLDCNHSYTIMNHVYAYGEQPPLIQEPVKLQLVKDKFEMNRGPAWFKILSYNKTVILPENWLLNPMSGGTDEFVEKRSLVGVEKRYLGGGGGGFDPPFGDLNKRKGVAQAGDRPWICTWPETYLELFIYAQQNSSTPSWSKPFSGSISGPRFPTGTVPPFEQTPSVTTMTVTTTADIGFETEASSDVLPETEHQQEQQTPPPFNNSPTPTSTPEQSTFHPNKNDRPENNDNNNSPPPNNPRRNRPRGMGAYQHDMTTTTTATTSPDTTPPPTILPTDFPEEDRPGFGFDFDRDSFIPPPPPYPRVIKLAERRVSTQGAPRARCTQVAIMGPRQKAEPVRDHKGSEVVIEVMETETFFGFGGGDLKKKKGDGDGTGETMTVTAKSAQEMGITGEAEEKREVPVVVMPRGWEEMYGGRGYTEEDEVEVEGWGLEKRNGVPDISPCGCMWFLT